MLLEIRLNLSEQTRNDINFFFKKNIDIYISWGSVLFAKKLFQILKFIWTQLLSVNITKSFLSLKTGYQNVAINMLLGEYLQKDCLRY